MHARPSLRSVAPLLVALLAAAGCDDDPGPLDPGAFTLTGPATAATIVAGGSTTATVTIARSGNFRAPVALSFAALPPGVTVTAAPATIESDATTSTLTISAAANATPGDASITVRANAAGMTQRTTAVPITITPAPAFTFALTANAVAVQAGQSATITADITRVGGFAGAVTFAVEGLPAGVTAQNVTTNGNTATITLVSAPGTVATTVSLVVRATATGMPERTAVTQLTVTPAPGFTLAVAPGTARAEEGRVGTVVANLTRVGGFAGAVTLSLENLPAGVTATPVTTAAATANLTFAVPDGVTPASVTATVRAVAAGLDDRTATTTVEVTRRPGTRVQSGVPVAGLSGAAHSQQVFHILVPEGATELVARTSGGSGDAHVYVDFIMPPPSPAEAWCASDGATTEEVCRIGAPNAGYWYIVVMGGDVAYENVTLTVNAPTSGGASLKAAAARRAHAPSAARSRIAVYFRGARSPHPARA